MHTQTYQKQIVEIYPAALWKQRHTWRNVYHLLPRNSCLLVIDGKNTKQTTTMRQVAQAFRQRGQQVLIWMFPGQDFARN